jgi:glutamyl-tRNA reductase
VSKFHGGVIDVTTALEETTGVPLTRLTDHLYVHYEDAAVAHAFQVACGLDSMAVGEAQILGQVRIALRVAQESDASGRVVGRLLQQALRVGKRAHAETGIDQAPRSMVGAALNHVPGDPRRWLIVGAGAMGALARAELERRGVTDITVVNRSGSHLTLDELPRLIPKVDVVVSATASIAPVITKSMVTAPVTIVDLALPRDVEPGVGDLPGVTLIDIEHLARSLPQHTRELDEVERIVEVEVEAFANWLRGAQAAPTVAALRARADDVVTAELRRLAQRRPDLTEDQRAEVAHSLQRVVKRLLHQPTVRVRQLAAEPGGETYTQLVRMLFELDTNIAHAADVPEVVE